MPLSLCTGMGSLVGTVVCIDAWMFTCSVCVCASVRLCMYVYVCMCLCKCMCMYV